MSLASWFSSMRPSHRFTRTETRRDGSRAFRRRASFDALESRRLLAPTASFNVASETVNQTTGSFNLAVSLSSPPAGAVTISNYAAIDTSDGIAVDKFGNLFVDDFNHNDVLEMTPAGVVTTLATGLLGPEGMVFGPNGDLYIAENGDGVDQVTPTGQVTDIANGPMFDDPRGIAVDASGNFYVSNYSNGTVVKITPAGVSLYASGFDYPGALAIDASGDLFVADYEFGSFNGGSVIEVTPSGTKKTFASGLLGPSGLAFDAAGNLYVGNTTSAQGRATSVNKVTPAGVVSTFLSSSSDGPLLDSGALCFDGAGNLYLAAFIGTTNSLSDEVLKVTQTVTVPFTLGGSAVSGVAYKDVAPNPLTFGIGITSANITGTLLPDLGPDQTLTFTLDTPTGGASVGSPAVNTMTINEPVGVFFGSAGETVSESDGAFTIPVTLSAPATEPASVPFSVSGSSSAFSGVTLSPLAFGVGQTTVDITGTLLSDPGPDQTLTFTLGPSPTGAVVGTQSTYTLTITEPAGVQFAAGNETVNASAGTFSIPVTVAGTPTVSTFASGFDQPSGLAADAAGNLYVPNVNGTVSKVTPADVVSTFASGLGVAFGVAFDAAGNLYVSDNGPTVTELNPAGQVIATVSGFNGSAGLAFDPAGNLYVADSGNDTVSKVTPAGVVSLFASGFNFPFGLAFHAGNLYVANGGTTTVSEVTPNGVVSTFASGMPGPTGLAFDAAGNLYVTVSGTDAVSEVTPAGVVSTLVGGFDEPAGLVVAGGNLYVANLNQDIEQPSTLSVVTELVAVPFTLGGSATSGVAYSNVNVGPLLFGVGQTTLDITGTLLSDPGPNQTLTFTLGTPVGGAVLGSPSTNTLTINESGTTGTGTGTGTSTSPTITGERVVLTFLKHNKKGKPIGKPVVSFVFQFSTAMNIGTTGDADNYQVDSTSTKKVKKHRVTVLNPVGFSATYNPSSDSVTLATSSKQKTFAKGGLITVNASPPNGVSSAAGAFLTGTTVFTIFANASGIS